MQSDAPKSMMDTFKTQLFTLIALKAELEDDI